MRATKASCRAAKLSHRPLPETQIPCWEQLLVDAIRTPGTISAGYSRFWNFSMGNQLLAMFECLVRGIEPGPIHTFKGWLHLNRRVKKGEKAITLCMPVKVKCKAAAEPSLESFPVDRNESQLMETGNNIPDVAGTATKTVFTFKPHWFVLSQTEGTEYTPTEVPAWSEAAALDSLSIQRISFAHTNGNCQGYALGRQVAVSPIAALPHKTLFHETAHILLGHTQEGNTLDDHDRTPTNRREVEAECVALICCESLGMPGAPECRGYIQHWLGRETIPDRSAQRIFKAADQILRAGWPAELER